MTPSRPAARWRSAPARRTRARRARRAAEPLRDRPQRLHPLGQQVAHRPQLAGLQVGEHRVEAGRAARSGSPRSARLGRAEVVALGQPGDQRVGERGHRRGLAERRLRVAHPQLERPEGRGAGGARTTSVFGSPAQRSMSANAAHEAITGGTPWRGSSVATSGRTDANPYRGPRRTARWPPARPAPAGGRAARCRPPACASAEPTATCTCSAQTSCARATSPYCAEIAS